MADNWRDEPSPGCLLDEMPFGVIVALWLILAIAMCAPLIVAWL